MARGLLLLLAALPTTTSAPLEVVGGTLYTNPFDLQVLLVTDPAVPHQVTLTNAVTAKTQ